MKYIIRSAVFCAGSALLLLSCSVSNALAQGTAFTYQGRLVDGGGPANGIYDLRFTIYDALANGNAVAGPLTNSVTTFNNGLFTVTLDFGSGVFTGNPLWMEIGVRTNGGGGFGTLNPRQQLTATPYAVLAGNVSGVVSNNALAGAYSGALNFNNPSNQFTGAFVGNGGGLNNVDATTLGGIGYSNFWRIGGNSGVLTNRYIGTVDYQPLELRVNNLRAIGILPQTNGWPNVLVGAPSSYILGDDSGASIGGGVFNGIGNTCGGSTIGGGRNNLMQIRVAGSFMGGGQWNLMGDGSVRSVIAGGYSNQIFGFTSTNAANIARDITDGTSNTILFGETPPGNATIGGGYLNSIGLDCTSGLIGGGERNVIREASPRSVVAGGSLNQIGLAVHNGFVGGGWSNSIGNSADYCALVGGLANSIGTNCPSGVIGGGESNQIGDGVFRGFIGGGRLNRIADGTDNTIVAGEQNAIQTGATYSSIGGGRWNTNSGTYAVIPGGALNYALGGYSFASGRRAKALHDGAFVWADSLDADFVSAQPNEFAVRADGSVRFITSGAGMTLDGQPVMAGYNGGTLTNLSASSLSGGTVPDACLSQGVARTNQVWLAGGNAGTSPGTQFLGTTDNRALEIKVNNERALRFEPNTNGAPNVIGGSIMNGVNTGIVGGTIGGGGATNYSGIAYLTTIASDFGTISGGRANAIRNSAPDSTIGGGALNAVNFSASISTIGGGSNNTVQNFAAGATIGGGLFNLIQNNSANGTIGGGANNSIQTNAHSATISGGQQNTVGTNDDYATVGGGYQNSIQGHTNVASLSTYSTIGGGGQNAIQYQGFESVIAGGRSNVIEFSAYRSTIGGGAGNDIASGSTGATIGGGLQNTNSGVAATVPGGQWNRAAGDSSFAAGYRAKADHVGSFVWADLSNTDFGSSGPDQFLIRASGGVGINTTNPVFPLTVGVAEATLTTTAQVAAFNSGSAFLVTRNTANNIEMQLGTDTAQGVMSVLTDHPLVFRAGNGAGTGNHEYMRIAQGGDVGIGRIPTANLLEVEGNASKTTAGSWLANSDARIKTDITTVTNALETLDQVRLVSFRYTDAYRAEHPAITDRSYLNVVAQEFARVFPEYVKSSGEKLPDGSPILQVDTYPLIIYSAAAVQELNRKLEEKTAKLAELSRQLQFEVGRRDAQIAQLQQRLETIEALLGTQNQR